MSDGRIRGQYRGDRYVAEFSLAPDLAAVWSMLQRIDEATQQPVWLSTWPRFAGESSTGEVVDVIEQESIRVHKHSEPCKGSMIQLILSDAGGQTRVRVEQYDLPDWVQLAMETFVIGGDQIVADLVLFLEQGVVLSRHSMPWAFPGFMVTEVGSGLAISQVMPGSYAARLGLVQGDRLVCLGGAPVFNQDGLQALLRILPANKHVGAQWVRAGQLLEASAQL